MIGYTNSTEFFRLERKHEQWVEVKDTCSLENREWKQAKNDGRGDASSKEKDAIYSEWEQSRSGPRRKKKVDPLLVNSRGGAAGARGTLLAAVTAVAIPTLRSM